MFRAPLQHSGGGYIPDPEIDAEIRAWMDQLDESRQIFDAEEERAERLIAAMADHDDGRDTLDRFEIQEARGRHDRDPNEEYHDRNRTFSVEGMAGL